MPEVDCFKQQPLETGPQGTESLDYVFWVFSNQPGFALGHARYTFHPPQFQKKLSNLKYLMISYKQALAIISWRV